MENIENKNDDLGEFKMVIQAREDFVKAITLGIVLFLVEYMEQSYASINHAIPAIQLSFGTAVAIILIWGYRFWVVVAFATSAVALSKGLSWQAGAIVSFGYTLGSTLGTYFVNRVIGVQQCFLRVKGVLLFVLCECLAWTLFATPLIGTGLVWTELIQGEIVVWYYLWLSGVTGVILVTPVIVTWFTKSFNGRITWESGVFILLLISTCHLVFGGSLQNLGGQLFTFKYLILPFLVWATFRFTIRELAGTVLIIAGLGFGHVWEPGTLVDRTNLYGALVSLQVFVCFITIMSLIMSFLINEVRYMSREMARLESLNLIGEVAAGIAHEIRNPMTTVRGFLQILEHRQYESQVKDYFRLMIEELDRANGIITEFLAVGRTTALGLKPQNLNDIVLAIKPLIEADAINQGIKVNFDLHKVPNLYLDSQEIRQLVLNLCRNGLEAMDSGLSLSICIYLQGEEVILSIHDQGKGIPRDVLPKLGVPFFTTKEKGTGLGLAVCYNIASAHHAKIEIDSCECGTTFFVKFAIA